MIDIEKIALKVGIEKHSIHKCLVARHSNGSWVDITEKLQSFANELQNEVIEMCAESISLNIFDNNDQPISRADLQEAIRNLKVKG